MFFHEEGQEVGESSSHQEGPTFGSVQIPFSLLVLDVPTHNALDMVMEMAAPGPSETDVAHASDDTNVARANALTDFGWCRIVEEPPDV